VLGYRWAGAGAGAGAGVGAAAAAAPRTVCVVDRLAGLAERTAELRSLGRARCECVRCAFERGGAARASVGAADLRTLVELAKHDGR
jgi:hypothetical protein